MRTNPLNNLIVIEGLDGTGKATQSKMLAEHLRASLFSFPNYNSKSSALVEMYLNGEFGRNAASINPYQASAMFAVDRIGTYLKEMKTILERAGKIIADRYTTSNILYQTAKFDSFEEKNDFIKWVRRFEYKDLQLPEPTQTFMLNVPFETFVDMMTLRNDNKHDGEDIHEADMDYLKKVYENAQYVAEKLHWDIIECADESGNLLSRREINRRIVKKLW